MTSGNDRPRRLYLDTNVLIAIVEQSTPDAVALRHLIETAGEISPAPGMARFVTSELSLAECLVGPMRDGNRELEGVYLDLLVARSWLDTVEIPREGFVAAARLRATYPALRLPDALHLASALLSGCTHFVSADRRLRDSYEIDWDDRDGSGLGRQPASIRVVKPDADEMTAMLNRGGTG